MQRREWLKRTGAVGVGASVVPWSQSHALANYHQAASYNELLQRITGNQTITRHTGITLLAPAHALNGAVVPVSVASQLPDTHAITILIEGGTSIVARLNLHSQLLDAQLSTHIRLDEPSIVVALVDTAAGWFDNTIAVSQVSDSCEAGK